jgi:hypothetical protein
MRFSLLITLVSFLFLSCQSLSKNFKSTASKNSVATPTEKNNAKNNAKRNPQTAIAKQPASNPALAQKTIYEELTGKKGLSAKQMPARVLDMARDARWKRDYVTALKRYNTIIVKYPKSKEVRQAYLDKAALYKEMGLLQQSKYNSEKAKR